MAPPPRYIDPWSACCSAPLVPPRPIAPHLQLPHPMGLPAFRIPPTQLSRPPCSLPRNVRPSPVGQPPRYIRLLVLRTKRAVSCGPSPCCARTGQNFVAKKTPNIQPRATYAAASLLLNLSASSGRPLAPPLPSLHGPKHRLRHGALSCTPCKKKRQATRHTSATILA